MCPFPELPTFKTWSPGPGYQTERLKASSDINCVFYLQSDTLVYSALPLINELKKRQSKWTVTVPKFNENASSALEDLNIPYKFYYSQIWSNKNARLVLFNDWDKSAQKVIYDARRHLIPSLCIQESMIDFSSKGRMKNADYAAVQGTFYRGKLERNQVLVTGNPRYESYPQNRILTATPKIMVNCNFTYGVQSENRAAWLSQVDQVLNQLPYSFYTSVHPRDSGNVQASLNPQESKASTIQNQFQDTTLLITRFSSLIHEAVLFGIPVIYFNPHNETEINNVCIDGLAVIEANTSSELKQLINQLAKHDQGSSTNVNNYIKNNILPFSEENPSTILVDYLLNGPMKAKRVVFSDRIKALYFSPSVRHISRWFRNKL